ncbi:MAG: hypothetical protein H7335_15995 [Massilia sp.]|nr:hypothetical protein [Massilia sp.]
MKRLFVLMCALGLSACGTTGMPGWQSTASAAASSYTVTRVTPVPASSSYSGAQVSAMEIERVPFRAGVSSTTVEKMATAQGCTGAGSQGAGLMTPQGPVEIYRMVCDSGRVFMARCEFRQCRPMSAPPASGYATPADGARNANHSIRGRQVPKLVVNWGCGGCQVNDRVPAMIVSAYLRAASASGYTVSDAETAKVSIVQFSERKPALRTLFGQLAGSDSLTTQTVFRGQQTMAQDTVTDSSMDMDLVGAHIGEQTFRNLTPRGR